MSYYKKELAILKDSVIYFKNVKLTDGFGNKTKTISLNKQSIPILMDWLANELKRLETVDKNGKKIDD